MTIDKKQEKGKFVLKLEGRLDTITSPKLQEVLIPLFGKGMAVVLDFALLEYISSAGLRVLLMGTKAANEKKVTMTIVNVNDEIMEVFDMTGFSDILTIQE